MKYISIALLLVTFAASQVSAQRTARKPPVISPYQATVSENEATFTFPIKQNQIYEWCPGGLQYEWSVHISPENKEKLSLGFSLFTAQGASLCESGNITKLLKSGQFDLWNNKDGGGFGIAGLTEEGFASYQNNYSDEFFIEKFKISAIGAGNRLTISFVGEKTLKILFSDKPKQLTFISQMGEIRKSVVVPVKYIAPPSLPGPASRQNPKPAVKPGGACIGEKEAVELVKKQSPEEVVRYVVEESISYKPFEKLADIKEGWPLVYLFYQGGYLSLDEGGYVFQSITEKGKRLNETYPKGFPIAEKTIASIDKVRCTGKKLRIDLTYSLIPTKEAISLLGTGIYGIKKLNEPWKTGFEFISNRGEWNLIPESRPYFLVD